ncbi:sulfite exporter TauE/SafE family protein [Rubrobacter aplysinae]|uniref:sulfite exporter TauE/SafE family protein n=1 Tax=Rubrobacter aplysinae TaxID=909625 RepID=UPI00064BC9A5|nr:sulfite exporter TauE/SafE family protein [Rubrobacter aplysinae]
MLELLEPAVLVAVAAVFTAGAVSGLVGFGFALVCVPLLLLVYDPATVIPVNVALSVFTTMNVAYDGRRDVEIKSIGLLLPFALLGIVLGVEVLRATDPDYIRVAVGVVVVVSALLLFRGVRLPGSRSRWGDGVIGGMSGLLATSVGISGPPVILLLVSRGMPKRAFRANIALYFVFTSLASLVALYLGGLIEPGHLLFAAALTPAAFIGKVAGTALMRRFSERAFRNLTLALILATGAGAAISAVLSLV